MKLVLKELLELPVFKALKARSVLRELKAQPVPKALSAHKAQLDQLVNRARPVYKVLRVPPALQVR